MRNKKTKLTRKFGMKVRLERAKRRLSQEALAEMADLSKKTICAIEAGTTTPSLETANDIANATAKNKTNFFISFNFTI